MKIAIIGAGAAATDYMQRFINNENDKIFVFTTNGDGEFLGKKISRLYTIKLNDYDKVVICSQYVDSIIQTLQEKAELLGNVYVFNYKVKQEQHLDADILTYKTGKTLYAYYPLGIMPLAFNYACFVNSAQVYANEHDYKKIVFIIASGRFRHVNYGGSSAYSTAQQYWRLSNLLPMISQLCSGYSSFLHFDCEQESQHYLTDKSPQNIFPENAVKAGYFTRAVEASFTIGPCLLNLYFKDVQTLQPIEQATDYIKNDFIPTISGKKIVTITLRETTFVTNRNSNIEEWQKFSAYLIEKGFQPVIIRDTGKALKIPEEELFPGAIFFSSAAFNIHIRTALFDLAYANLGTDCGAIALALFMKHVKFCFFFADHGEAKKVLSHEIETAKARGASTALAIGSNYPFLSQGQKLVWRDEIFENIVDEFESLTNSFEKLY